MNTFYDFVLSIFCWLCLSISIVLIIIFLVLLSVVGIILECATLFLKKDVTFSTGYKELNCLEEQIFTMFCAEHNINLEIITQQMIISSSKDASTDVHFPTIHVKARCFVLKNNHKKSDKNILLVHGANTGPLCFKNVFVPLTDLGYTLYCVSLPGYNGYEISDIFYSFNSKQFLAFYDHFFQDLIENVLAIENTIVLGHSFGGFLVSSLSYHCQKRISSVVLVNAAGIYPTLGIHGMYWALLFKLGFPNRFARLCGRFLNPLLYYLTKKEGGECEKYIRYWDYMQMTCNQNYGYQVVPKFITFKSPFKSYWNETTFQKLLHVSKLKRISFIWGYDDSLIPFHNAVVLAEKTNISNGLYAMQGSHNPIEFENGRDFMYVLKHVLNMEHDECNNELQVDLNDDSDSSINMFKDFGFFSFSTKLTGSNIENLYSIINQDMKTEQVTKFYLVLNDTMHSCNTNTCGYLDLQKQIEIKILQIKK